MIHGLIHWCKLTRGTAVETLSSRFLVSVSSATTVAAAATAATATVAASATATAATTAAFTRTSLVDDDLPTIEIRSIKSANGFIATRLHFHESKSLGSARVSVTDDLCGSDYAILAESLFQTF
jgi:hypothetical protein